jgi:hypothetical protein
MRTLPTQMIRVLLPFVPLFSRRVFGHAQVLLAGAILAPGARTVSSALRAMGLDQEKRFHRYHRVLSRASWSSLEVARVLLRLVVEAFVPEGSPLVVGIDETLERRYGKKISARGVYRDPVRSTHETFVKSSGLRWVCAMLLVEIPWAARVWGLPFLSALAPSERYAAKRGKRHKKITEWAWQLLLVLRRWYPEREIVAVADRAYASLTPGPPVHRPRSRSGADRPLVRKALAVGGDLSGGPQAPGIRDAEAVVGDGHKAHHTGAFGAVLAGHLVRRSPDARGGGSLATSGGLVPKEASHLRRCARCGAKGAVGRSDFLRVARTEGHDKSAKGPRGTINRGGLLRGVNG